MRPGRFSALCLLTGSKVLGRRGGRGGIEHFHVPFPCVFLNDITVVGECYRTLKMYIWVFQSDSNFVEILMVCCFLWRLNNVFWVFFPSFSHTLKFYRFFVTSRISHRVVREEITYPRKLLCGSYFRNCYKRGGFQFQLQKSFKWRKD